MGALLFMVLVEIFDQTEEVGWDLVGIVQYTFTVLSSYIPSTISFHIHGCGLQRLIYSSVFLGTLVNPLSAC